MTRPSTANQHAPLIRNARGQITLFVMLWWPVLFLFAFLITDLAQVINNKVRLQLSADASALAGAVTQAEGLNQIASINNQINIIWNQYYLRATTIVYPSQFLATLDLNTTKQLIQGAQNTQIRLLNRTYPLQVRARAQAVALLNYPAAQFEYVGDSGQRPGGQLFTEQQRSTQYIVNYRYLQPTPTGAVVLPGVHFGSLRRITKNRNRTTYYTVRLTLPPEGVVAGKKPFNKPVTKASQAVAQAKPYGGTVYDTFRHVGIPKYKAKLIPIRTNMSNQNQLGNRNAYYH